MKIRQSELVKMIRHSLNESAVNLTGRINNKKKFKGDNFNQTNDAHDADNLSFDQIINNAVVLSNFKNPETFDEIRTFAEGDKYDDGYNYFCSKLQGVVNQIYGTPLNDDYVEGYSVIDDNDPLGGEDPFGDYVWMGPKNSPFEWDELGYVMPKENMQLPDPAVPNAKEQGVYIPVTEIFDRYFEKYEGNNIGQMWENAVVHEDKGEIIFLFENIFDRKCFTKQIKNMFWICKKEKDFNHGGVGYKYAFYAMTNPFEITEYDNWNVEELVSDENNPQDMDVRSEILRRKQLQNDYLKSQESEPEQEIDPTQNGETVDSEDDDYAAGFENGVFHDSNGNRVKGPLKTIRENKNKMKITESQLRKMVQNILKEMI